MTHSPVIAPIRPPADGAYNETMPANLGPDGDLLQASLLAPLHIPRKRASLFDMLTFGWIVHLAEAISRMWRTWLAMMGVGR